MRKLIKTRDLKKGMHVVLDLPWHQHPFLKNSFDITSEKDISRLLKAGIEEVPVDTASFREVPPAVE
ncbi:MAG: hypothetical protein A4E66_01785 [Syntrophus sp. PtaB.Bin001]|nr:MAG: hypothetical protein A4E66_01785 [Syntrophus sp. PtaB.Bin001]